MLVLARTERETKQREDRAAPHIAHTRRSSGSGWQASKQAASGKRLQPNERLRQPAVPSIQHTSAHTHSTAVHHTTHTTQHCRTRNQHTHSPPPHCAHSSSYNVPLSSRTLRRLHRTHCATQCSEFICHPLRPVPSTPPHSTHPSSRCSFPRPRGTAMLHAALDLCSPALFQSLPSTRIARRLSTH